MRVRTVTCCLSQLGGDARGGGLTERDRGSLLRVVQERKGPRSSSSAVGKQRGVETNAVAVGGGMQRDVDGGVRGVGEKGAFVERKVGVGIAQNERGDSATLQFLAQTAGEGDGDVFLGERELRASPRSLPPWLASTTAK